MKVRLFGVIAEAAGSELLEIDAASTGELRDRLEQRLDRPGAYSYSIAVERRIVRDDLPLEGHEEIAVLPPFSGG